MSPRVGAVLTTNSKPMSPGAIVRKDTEPSGLVRDPTSLFHSPKSKMVAGPRMTTLQPDGAMKPLPAVVVFGVSVVSRSPPGTVA